MSRHNRERREFKRLARELGREFKPTAYMRMRVARHGKKNLWRHPR